MKQKTNRIILYQLVVVIFISLWGGISEAAFLPQQTSPQGVAVHRFWSDVFKHQFITISEDEKNFVIANDRNWRYDGVAFRAFITQQPGTVPLYRFWSDTFKGHFYTTNEAEKQAVEKNIDWRYEGIAFYVFPETHSSTTGNVVPVYRLWSDQNHYRGHFYTTFYREAAVLSQEGNYAYEGPRFKAVAAPGTNKKLGLHIPPFETGWTSHPPPYNDYQNEIYKKNDMLKKQQHIVMFFSSWEQGGGMETFGSNISSSGGGYRNGWLADQIHNAGATPLITWEPWMLGGGVHQAKYSLDNIANGTHDAYLRQYARDVKNWGHPILLRPMHEMNGDYYPWSCTINGDDPAKYVRAFQHIKKIFMEEGADNAKFVWSPNYASPPQVSPQCKDLSRLYPGDEYVDYIGVSAYNWGKDTSRGPGWVQLQKLLDPFLDYTAQHFPDKQVIVAEMGVAHDAPDSEISQWLHNTYNYLSKRGTVTAVVYFDDFAYHDSSAVDFRITTGHSWQAYPVSQTLTNTYRDISSLFSD